MPRRVKARVMLSWAKRPKRYLWDCGISFGSRLGERVGEGGVGALGIEL